MFGEDLSVGELFRSPGHVISEEECVHFATQWDPLDIHTSPREADQGWHDGLIVSGLHTLCLHQAVMAREETHSWSIVGGTKLGVRFSRPVRPGDRLEVTATMIEATRRAVRGVDATDPWCTVIVQGQVLTASGQPALEIDLTSVLWWSAEARDRVLEMREDMRL